MYLTTEENFQKTRDKQWPYTFEADPTWKPTLIVKTIDVLTWTAVLATMSGGDKRAGVHRVELTARSASHQVGGLATEKPAVSR